MEPDQLHDRKQAKMDGGFEVHFQDNQCLHCGKQFHAPSHQKRHFEKAHEAHAVRHGNFTCFPCKLRHDNLGSSSRAHYHCPECNRTVLNRNPFVKHIQSHELKRTLKTESSINGNGSSLNKQGVSETHSDDKGTTMNQDDSSDLNPSQDHHLDKESVKPNQADEENVNLERVRRNVPVKRNCPICGELMHPKSVKRHCRDVHKSDIFPSSVCVDEKGIFLVRKSSKGGVSHPIHVKKNLSRESSHYGVQCEEQECMDLMRIAKRSGMPSVECRHLQSAMHCPSFPEHEHLRTEYLNDLGAGGQFRLLTEESIQSCIKLQEDARHDNAYVIAKMDDSERFMHLSVFNGDINYYARLGRCVVTVDMSTGTMDCRCSRRKRSCIHKNICLWYLNQMKMIDMFRGSVEHDIRNVPDEVDRDTDDPSSDKPVYPPTDEELIAKMCRYIHENKQVPVDSTQRNKLGNVRKLIPKEKYCHFCKQELDVPRRICKDAFLVTRDGVIEGFEMYFKKCAKCGVCYRYQEYEHGIHNFNDRLLIDIEFGKYLRECLLEHVPIGSIINIHNQMTERQLDNQALVNAFLHFDSLSGHKYEYHCTICGHHPVTLIFDLNRKVVFNCDAADLHLPDNYQEQDHVDVEEFWRKVELSMVLRGFPQRKVKDFVVEPNLLHWAPFIGKDTRKGQLVLNTEHRKVRRQDKTLEQDCRDVTEERLIEMLQHKTRKEIEGFSKSLGVKPQGTKLEILTQIRNAISQDCQQFNKAFRKLWGKSGGWVSGACEHGVVYALKFNLRAESPRDYVDLLLSFEHQPNVVIVDMPQMVTAHGNKRSVDMFHPHRGMAVEPTEENIARAKQGELLVSMPWMTSDAQVNVEAGKGTNHPITGSSTHLCLFDRLHERNTRSDSEILRRITLIKELKGLLNTQVDEHLHSSYNHDSRFLNQMKPVNHVYLFRSLVDVKNRRRNSSMEQRLAAEFKRELKHDRFGRCFIDKSNRMQNPNMDSKPAATLHVDQDQEKDNLKKSPSPNKGPSRDQDHENDNQKEPSPNKGPSTDQDQEKDNLKKRSSPNKEPSTDQDEEDSLKKRPSPNKEPSTHQDQEKDNLEKRPSPNKEPSTDQDEEDNLKKRPSPNKEPSTHQDQEKDNLMKRPSPNKEPSTHQDQEKDNLKKRPSPNKEPSTDQDEEDNLQKNPNPDRGPSTDQDQGKDKKKRPNFNKGQTAHQDQEKDKKKRPNPNKGLSTNQDQEKKKKKRPNPTLATDDNCCQPPKKRNIKKQGSKHTETDWMRELNLKIEDKHLIEGEGWMNDRIINASMKLLHEKAPHLSGFEDVIVATRHGYTHDAERKKFVQIINVRGCHWIVISNVNAAPCEVDIYDSQHSSSIKEKGISYPVSIEEAMCQIVKPTGSFMYMCVTDVQQQRGGNDCGLFAIAFAASLSRGEDPSKIQYCQEKMRNALVEGLEKKDMSLFLDKIIMITMDESPENLFEWWAKVYCHCRMPDSGDFMGQCCKCGDWFHKKCESGNMGSPGWYCYICNRNAIDLKAKMDLKAKRRDRKRNMEFKKIRDLYGTHDETKKVVALYDAIMCLVPNHKLPNGASHVGCMTLQQYHLAIPDSKERLQYGITHYDPVINDLCIIVFPDVTKSDDKLLSTLLHELGHALHLTSENSTGQSHGSEFRKWAKHVMKYVKEFQSTLPSPFDKVDIDSRMVMTAKS